jgi:hypothetical protein
LFDRERDTLCVSEPIRASVRKARVLGYLLSWFILSSIRDIVFAYVNKCALVVVLDSYASLAACVQLPFPLPSSPRCICSHMSYIDVRFAIVHLQFRYHGDRIVFVVALALLAGTRRTVFVVGCGTFLRGRFLNATASSAAAIHSCPGHFE